MTMGRINTPADVVNLPSPLLTSGAHGVQHGGPDAGGAPVHDFSTNSNACGPCPEALCAVQRADPTRYPDPAYTVLRHALGAFHGVAAHRIVLAGSASEFIHRMTAWVARHQGGAVALPAHSYGDYLHAAQAWGLPVWRRTAHSIGHVEAVGGSCDGEAHPSPSLQWACEPSSPLGVADPVLAQWQADTLAGTQQLLDCAYVPLRLDGVRADFPATAWQLWTPNKALGLTGIRAAYAIAPVHTPRADVEALLAMAPSWPVGAHGVAMLNAWVDASVQQWLQASLLTLRGWKAPQQALCHALGWREVPGSLANYFVAHVPQINAPDLALTLQALRAQGIKLRDCASFGLPGHVRLGVLAPASQQALQQAWPHTISSINRSA